MNTPIDVLNQTHPYVMLFLDRVLPSLAVLFAAIIAAIIQRPKSPSPLSSTPVTVFIFERPLAHEEGNLPHLDSSGQTLFAPLTVVYTTG